MRSGQRTVFFVGVTCFSFWMASVACAGIEEHTPAPECANTSSAAECAATVAAEEEDWVSTDPQSSDSNEDDTAQAERRLQRALAQMGIQYESGSEPFQACQMGDPVSSNGSDCTHESDDDDGNGGWDQVSGGLTLQGEDPQTGCSSTANPGTGGLFWLMASLVLFAATRTSRKRVPVRF